MLTPTHRLVQVTDTHITSGELLYDVVDSLAQLERSLQIVADGIGRLDALVLTGDLADDGSPAAYRRLKEVVEPVAERLQAPVVYLPGNHDERRAFRAELLGEPDDDPAWDRPVDAVVDLAGLRLVLVDSSRPGVGDGHLSADQAKWLGGVLSTPAAAGTVLAIHHPPLPTADEFLDDYGFRDREELGAVVAGSDVRLIISGHWHQAGTGSLAGIPVWVGASTASTTAPLSPRTERFAIGSGVSLIEMFPDGSVVTQGVPTLETVGIEFRA